MANNNGKIMTKADMTTQALSYTMSKECAADLLANRKADERKMSKQDYLCKCVNEQLGLRGYCIGVKIV